MPLPFASPASFVISTRPLPAVTPGFLRLTSILRSLFLLLTLWLYYSWCLLFTLWLCSPWLRSLFLHCRATLLRRVAVRG